VVREILVQETQLLNIEFATLVDANRRIVENANRPRPGEVFDPQGLVSEVLLSGRPLRSSEWLPFSELARESGGLARAVRETSGGVQPQGVLVRYVVTPVRSGSRVVGALVAGDLVTGKPNIVDDALTPLQKGLNAVFYRDPRTPGAIPQLATLALVAGDDPASFYRRQAAGLPLQWLTERVVAASQPQLASVEVDGEGYALAALSLRNLRGETVGILLRGTPDRELRNLLVTSVLIELAIGAAIFALAILLGRRLTEGVTRPLSALEQQARRLANGQLDVRAEVGAADEVGLLARTFNRMAESIQASTRAARQEAELRRREAEKQQAEKENLQEQVLQLLLEVEGATRGDLTVRAQVNAGEMGTVADTFNATIYYLREIVLQVKDTVSRVGSSVQTSEQAMQRLAREADRQREQVSQSFAQVQTMGGSPVRAGGRLPGRGAASPVRWSAPRNRPG
jgi:twitching motility protein PilJ